MRVHFWKPDRTKGFAVATALFSTMACGPSDAGEAPDSTTLASPPTPVESPALDGSGEPHLSAGQDGLVLSWLEPGEGDAYDLRVARWEGGGWSEPSTVVSSEKHFVNWADFPSVVSVDGTLWAHWLERGEQGGYDYGVRVTRSSDGGATWSPSWTPHTDGTPTEHGFVSTFAHPEGGVGFVWLDGRKFAEGPDGEAATEEMTLRTRRVEADGTAGSESVIDERICDCCQTDAAMTSAGPIVVYRDRDAEEIRDIYASRFVEGSWTTGAPVYPDGWRIAACPVNGPAVTAEGDRVAVAWFTAARDTAAVKVAFSRDAGATFDPAVRVDEGRPAGRVDVVGLPDGSAMVSWIERVRDGGAEIRVRRVHPDGTLLAASRVSAASSERAGGFPQMVLHDGRLHFAWTDVAEDGSQGVRVAHVPVPLDTGGAGT